MLLPDEPEPAGLLALMLLQHSRRAARVGEQGELVLLEAQDRARWDSAAIAQALPLVDRALTLRRPPGPYALQAAIAAVHAGAARAEATDWRQIALLYAELANVLPSPVVTLNRAVAIAMADGPAAGLALDRRARERRRARRLPPAARRARRPAAARGPPGRGGDRLPARAGAGDERSPSAASSPPAWRSAEPREGWHALGLRRGCRRARQLARRQRQHLLAQVADLGVVAPARARARTRPGTPWCGRCAPARARGVTRRAVGLRRERGRELARRDLRARVARQVRDEREVEQALLRRRDRARALERLARTRAVEAAQPQAPEPLQRGGVARRALDLALGGVDAPARASPCPRRCAPRSGSGAGRSPSSRIQSRTARAAAE